MVIKACVGNSLAWLFFSTSLNRPGGKRWGQFIRQRYTWSVWFSHLHKAARSSFPHMIYFAQKPSPAKLSGKPVSPTRFIFFIFLHFLIDILWDDARIPFHFVIWFPSGLWDSFNLPSPCPKASMAGNPGNCGPNTFGGQQVNIPGLGIFACLGN